MLLVPINQHITILIVHRDLRDYQKDNIHLNE